MKEFETDVLGSLVFEGKYKVRVFEANLTDNESRKMKKEKGRYVSLNSSFLIHTSILAKQYVINILSEKIKTFLISKNVLVVGLGNAFLIADSLGSRVIQDIVVTHDMPYSFRRGLADVSALISGVSGINGFPTARLVKSVVGLVKPDQVIVIDSFISHSLDRVGCSFQLSDTGITAGAGLGRKNQSLNSAFLGVPVLSIGVPLMMNARDFGADETYVVTPKEIDILSKNCAKILAKAINLALHGEKYSAFF